MWNCSRLEERELVTATRWEDASGRQDLCPAESASLGSWEGFSLNKPAGTSQSSLERKRDWTRAGLVKRLVPPPSSKPTYSLW